MSQFGGLRYGGRDAVTGTAGAALGSNSRELDQRTCQVTLSVLHHSGQGLDCTSVPPIRLAPLSLAEKLLRTFSAIVARAKSGVDPKCWFSVVLLIPCRGLARIEENWIATQAFAISSATKMRRR